MKIIYANEGKAIVPISEKVDATEYDTRAMLEKAISVKSARDFFGFIKAAPASFFARTLHDLDADVMVNDIVNKNGTKLFGTSIPNMLSKYFPDIEYLDELVVQSGELGKVFVEKHEYPDGTILDLEKISMEPGYCELFFSIIESFIANGKILLALAAVANGEAYKQPPFTYLQSKNDAFKIIDSGLNVTSDVNKLPIQQPAPLTYFSEDSVSLLKEVLNDVAVEKWSGDYQSKNGTAIFVFPNVWQTQAIAANIFTSFMNTLFEGNLETWLISNNFKVEYSDDHFSVRKINFPVQDYYHEIAKAAASKAVGLCPYCGAPVLRTSSRGNKAQFCSNSCKTLSTKRRREEVIKYAASGIPVQDAVSLIGGQYEESIRRWYQEVLDTNPAR